MAKKRKEAKWFEEYIEKISEVDSVGFVEVVFKDPKTGVSHTKLVKYYENKDLMNEILEGQVRGFLSRLEYGLIKNLEEN